MKKIIPILILALISIYLFTGSSKLSQQKISEDTLYFEGEKHFKNIKQLTFGGENAEAYFSFDGKKLSFQSTRDSRECDQIYRMNIDGSDQTLISNGKGRTTCAYYMPDNKHILFASTHLVSDLCPPKPDFRNGYVWAL